MVVKANWENGEQYNATDQNDIAAAVNAAYVKPGTGIPITDFTSGVQVSLGKADSAVQSVDAAAISDSTTTGRGVLTAVDAAAARTALGVAYGTTSSTVAVGNDSRFSPSSTSISDATTIGKALLTSTDASTARTSLGVAYGTSGTTVAVGNDSRITGAEQSANKGTANGYASLDSGGKVPMGQLPSSLFEYKGVYNATTNTPTLADGTGDSGDVYRVTTAGSQNLGSGSISFAVGDYAIYNTAGVWEKSDTTDAVSSVGGLTGDISVANLKAAIGTGSWTQTIGDGSSSTLTVTHNLGTSDVLVSVRDSSTNVQVDCDVTVSSDDAISLAFASPPGVGEFKVTVVGGEAFVVNANVSSVFLSNEFQLKSESDATKVVVFGLSNVSSGATRTLAVPNASTTLVGTDVAQTLSGKTLSNPIVTDYVESVVAVGTVTTAHTLSLNGGTVQTATLTASTACTFTMPAATAGKSFVLMLKQAATTGNGTATFTSVKWSGGTAPTITATAAKMDILSFFADGTNWYGSATQNFTP